VLDPVGAGATTYRTETAHRILTEVDVAVVRGNAAEVATLAGRDAEIRGVESIGACDAAADVAHTAAQELDTVVAVTGAIDYVSDGEQTLTVANGDPLLAMITGSGCIATAVTGAFLAVRPEAPLAAAAEALAALGVAGEDAAGEARGPGSFHVALYDALYALDPATLDERVKLK
jgi:hydroxyethylthiazole kinase